MEGRFGPTGEIGLTVWDNCGGAIAARLTGSFVGS